MSTLSIDEIRQLMAAKYGEEDENHPMTAVGIVLLSALVLGTTDARTIQTFHGLQPGLRLRNQ